MPLGLPESATEVEDRVKLDVAREATDSNPYVQNSWLLALVVGFSRRIFDFYRDLKRSEDNTFPDTATGERADQWATIYIKSRTAATQATGNVAATGTAATVIPAGTLFSASGNNYTSQLSATINTGSIGVTSITRSGTTATATTVGNHNLGSNVPVTISGANEADYNVTDAAITVTGLNTFTYQISSGAPASATGTILAGFTTASVNVLSVEFGLSADLALDTPLTLQSPIAGADDVMNVDFNAITGGTDAETDDELKARYLDRIQNPVAHFNAADIVSKAKEVPGVTRVFVQEAAHVLDTIPITTLTSADDVAIATRVAHGFEDHQQITVTGTTQVDYNVVNQRIIVLDADTYAYPVANTPTSPATGGPTATASVPNGAVEVYFTRDNDMTNIPSGAEIATVRDKLNEIRPANTSDASMIVAAPLAVPVAFTFTALTPNTLTMQAAINANLSQFFAEETIVGVGIDTDAYRAVIKNTVDTTTGNTVTDFTLSLPAGDVTINAGELGTLGLVTI